MYSTCLFCHTGLGANTVVEEFPIGRRLAFDAVKGRLWVVCGKCERWNLTPIEERWEAIETCERLFRATQLRMSTDNIGLARVREGLELVRIGSALRPEMAAWRYGDQFGRRRRRYLAVAGAVGATAVGLAVLGPITGILAVGGMSTTFNVFNWGYTLYRTRTVRAQVSLPGRDRPLVLRQAQLTGTAIESLGDEWRLHLMYDAGKSGLPRTDDADIQAWYQGPARWASASRASVVLTGRDAIRAAGQILPVINRSGAGKRGVANAVRVVEQTPDAESLFGRALLGVRRPGVTVPAITVPGDFYGKQLLGSLPPHMRLAMEMVAHEDTERRALEGELALLETAWRDAEEIAAIADAMFTSPEVDARFDALKRPPESPG